MKGKSIWERTENKRMRQYSQTVYLDDSLTRDRGLRRVDGKNLGVVTP